MSRFTDLGVAVAGLSKDSVKAQANFATKHNLNYPLLSDTQTDFLQSLGAWGEKKSGGKVTRGVFRTTFIFDQNGNVVKGYAKVKAKGHAEAVLEELKDLH